MVSSPFSHSERIHLLEIRFSILEMKKKLLLAARWRGSGFPFRGGNLNYDALSLFGTFPTGVLKNLPHNRNKTPNKQVCIPLTWEETSRCKNRTEPTFVTKSQSCKKLENLLLCN